MDMKSADIEKIVRQVLESMGSSAAPARTTSSASVPATARVAMLTKLEHFDLQEYPIPLVRILAYIEQTVEHP
jgi:hypothetical protein